MKCENSDIKNLTVRSYHHRSQTVFYSFIIDLNLCTKIRNQNVDSAFIKYSNCGRELRALTRKSILLYKNFYKKDKPIYYSEKECLLFFYMIAVS